MKKLLIGIFVVCMLTLTVFSSRSGQLPYLYTKTAPKVVLIHPYMAPVIETVINLENMRIVIVQKFRWGAKYIQGSGVFVREDGVILTAAHVARASGIFRIETSEGHVYRAGVIAIDPDLDIAMLKIIPNPQTKVKVARIGRERPSGWPVYAVGNPIGFRWLVTSGIISGYDDNYLISDAVINPGSSGGGLFDAVTAQLQGITVGLFNPVRMSAFAGHGASIKTKDVQHFIERNMPLCG